MAETYPREIYPLIGVKAHDPSGGTRKRTAKILLGTGEQLVTPTAFVPVDAVTREPLVPGGGELALNDVTYGLIASTPKGDIWGVNFYPRFGRIPAGLDEAFYLLQLTPYVSTQAGIPLDDVTFRLRVRQT